MTTLLTLTASLAGGAALLAAGWRMEMATVRVARAVDESTTEEGPDDDQQPLAA